MSYLDIRKNNIRHFRGKGLDIGPFNCPYVPDPDKYGLEVETVDRWEPEQLKAIFPEISSDEVVPLATFVGDISAEGLFFSEDARYDFVVCSHVIEHVADPLYLLAECFRVLKPMGVLYLGAPDVRISFDKGRKATSYDYIFEKYVNKVRKPLLDDLKDYFSSDQISQVPWVQAALRENRVNESILEHESKRSFHVHTWTARSFVDHVIKFLCDEGLQASLIDLYLTENTGYDNSILLRKEPGYAGKRLRLDVESLFALRLSQGVAHIDDLCYA